MMYRYILIFIISSCFIINAYGQIGINTTNPLGVLHIDSKGDTSGTKESPVNDSDDVVITTDGKLGIGTINPLNRVSVIDDEDTNFTGLQLPTGAKTNYILYVDASGNGVWEEERFQYQTLVANPVVADATLTSTSNAVATQITSFGSTPIIDNARKEFGAPYGWDPTTQQYTAPEDGLYRLTSQVYFMPNTIGYNYRSYWILNGTLTKSLGFSSITDNGKANTAYSSNVYSLKKGDVLALGITVQQATTSSVIKYKQGLGYTFVMIELIDY